MQLIWICMENNRANKIYLSLSGVDILKDTDWPHIAKFHADASKSLYLAFKERLEQYLKFSYRSSRYAISRPI